MHELFADWLEEVGLDVRTLPLSSWWEGLEAYCAALNRESLLSLLRLASRGEGSEALIPVGFREALKEKDAAFKMRGNAFLVAELARAATRILFDAERVNHDLGCAAALGMIVASFHQTVGPVHADHLQKAHEYLTLRAEELRARPEIEEVAAHDELSKAIHSAGDVAQLKNALTKLAPILSLASSSIDTLAARLRLQDEELDILWWLFAEASRDLKTPLRELHPGVAAIVAASEMADMVAFPPGPNSTEACLRRVLFPRVDGKPASVRVADAVNALDKEWKQRAATTLKPLGSATALCPLHLMIAKASEAASPEDWPALVRASCEVNTDLDLEPVSLGLQVFQERMFCRALRSVPDSNG